MTDSEAWAVLGVTIREAGVVGTGLCACLWDMEYHRIISSAQRARMVGQLHDAYSDGLLKDLSCTLGFFWPRGELDPRVRACFKLARLTAKKG